MNILLFNMINLFFLHLGSVLGSVWGYFGEVFGGVLEAFVWYLGRFLGGKDKEKIKEKKY